MKFIGRQRELHLLEKLYEERKSQLVVVYGRRRVGKTTLIKEFIKDKPALYFLASTESSRANLDRFVDMVGEVFGNYAPGELSLADWHAAFRHFVRQIDATKGAVLVIDELPYLIRSEPAFPSILQEAWDETLKESNVMLILCGSHVGMMASATLGYESPLYGRRTAQIKLRPLSFKAFSDAFPSLDFAERVRLYGITGGVPRYMEIFEGLESGAENLARAIQDKILDTSSPLATEPLFLLQSDNADRGLNYALLRVMASGARKLSDIASKLMLKSTSLTPYLEQLADIGYIRREVPITENFPHKSRRGLYFINDNFLDFWFKFVYPYQSYLELGHYETALRIIERDLDVRHTPFVYENICMELLLDYYATYKAQEGVTPLKFGRLWNDKDEIDIALIDSENNILLGECKFRNAPVGLDVLNGLQAKAAKIKELKQYTLRYALFSKSGFDFDADSSLAACDIMLFDCERIVRP